jgi:hypothetical protein
MLMTVASSDDRLMSICGPGLTPRMAAAAAAAYARANREGPALAGVKVNVCPLCCGDLELMRDRKRAKRGRPRKPLKNEMPSARRHIPLANREGLATAYARRPRRPRPRRGLK